MNKENASKLWKIIQEAGDYLVGQLPDHPNHPKGRNPYAHVAICVKSKFNASYKDMMSRDRSLFGEFIKGKLQRGGHLNENEKITSDTLISYGRDEIVLKKIDDTNYFIEF